MANDPGEYRVYNHTDRDLIIATDEDKRQQFRLLPRSVSPTAAKPRYLWAAGNNSPIDGALVWKLTPGFDVHISETSFESTIGGRAPVTVSPTGSTANLHISGLGIRPTGDPVPEATPRTAWFCGDDDFWVTVLGAGVTGLTVAHELVTRGFRVQVIDRAHGSPAGLMDGKSGVERFRRGLTSPDVGGVARTQWATQPLDRAGQGLLGAAASPDFGPSALRSVHGDAIWFGASARGSQAMPGDLGYRAFGITWSGARIDRFAKDLLVWLRAIGRTRSVAAVQLVAVAYTGDAPDHVARAYRRVDDFIQTLAPAAPDQPDQRPCFVRALGLTLDRLQVLPTARIDVAEREPTDQRVGLIVRVHEDLGLIAGEHGFRFFPGFYRHLRDTMQRTPIFDPVTQTFTPRTALDNLQQVEWQVFVDPARRHQAALSRQPFTTISGVIEQYRALRRDLGYRPIDLLRFCLRILRYMTSSVKRRTACYETMSWWTFLSKRHLDDPRDEQAFRFGARFVESLRHAPKALVAMDSVFADARTQGNISVQLLMDQFGLHDQGDATLNGPTSTNWLTHWQTYLTQQGVKFFLGEATRLRLDRDGDAADRSPPRLAVDIAFPCGTPDEYLDGEAAKRREEIKAHYIVSALDVVALARLVRDPTFADAGVFSDVLELTRNSAGDDRDLEDITTVGVQLADRFQTLTGIQLYYQRHVSFANGHMYFASSPWGISAISQVQFWGPFGSGRRSKLTGNLSIDIGSWRAEADMPHPNSLDRDAIADRVQQQITRVVGPDGSHGSAPSLRVASYYHLDDYIGFGPDPVAGGHGPRIVPRRNHAPFLINVVGDWQARPQGTPWSPNDLVSRDRKPGAGRGDGELWLPERGGYPVHYGNAVVAGPHLRTFTRMTTMEAANESARHAVNTILDHMSFQFPETSPEWASNRFFRFEPNPDINVDKNTTAFGDYCDIWNPELFEFSDLEFLRNVDSYLMEAGAKTRDDDAPAGVPRPVAPHLFDILKIDELPDMLEDDRDAINALELVGSVLRAFDDARIDDVPGVFAVIDGARKKLAALLKRAK